MGKLERTMKKSTVYLAGPVSGLTELKANDWRWKMIERLEPFDIIGVSPLRCEMLSPGNEKYGTESSEPCFGTYRAISSKNYFDIRNCDMVLAYFPEPETTTLGASLGTIVEISRKCAMHGKESVIVVSPKFRHPLVDACAGWWLSTLDEAFDVLVGVLSIYG